MHGYYGEPNDEAGKHIVCEECGYCKYCNDCKCSNNPKGDKNE